MKVKVIPQRPISGILPKNKWIDQEMECDLNKAEIMRCMQFGSVYDMSGRVIDTKYLQEIPNMLIERCIEPIVATSYDPEDIVIIEEISNKVPEETPESITIVASSADELIVIESNAEVPEEVFVTGVEVVEIPDSIELLSFVKED